METKEQFGGYYLIEAKDMSEVIQVAARIQERGSERRGAAGRGRR